MAGDETERFERLQQRRQQRHDVVDHRLAHGALQYGGFRAFNAAGAP
jgi:hypothetical protein